MIILDTNSMEKKASSLSDKCFYKELYHGGASGPYTAISILEPGAAYPKHHVVEGLLEYFVQKGIFHLNGSDCRPGSFIQLEKGEYSEASSKKGCQVIVILKGKVEF